MDEFGKTCAVLLAAFLIFIVVGVIATHEAVGIDNMTTGKVIEIDDDTMVTCQLTEKSKSILKLKEELKNKKSE